MALAREAEEADDAFGVEHVRSQIEDPGGRPHFTKNEIELVRFISVRSFDWGVLSGSDAAGARISVGKSSDGGRIDPGVSRRRLARRCSRHQPEPREDLDLVVIEAP